jgi:hypothetical protein
MQLTRFDRWLRKRFVHETHIYTMRPPEEIPRGLIADTLPDTPGRQFRHRYIARQPELATRFVEFLKSHNMMFTTRVVDRSAWYVPLLAPRGKSLTYWIAWVLVGASAALTIGVGVRKLWAIPEFRENLADAVRVLQG